MQFTERTLPPSFGVKAVDDAAAELLRLQEAANAAQKDAVEAEHALERAEISDREERAAAIRSNRKPKADKAAKAKAELERLQRVAGDYEEAVRQASDDLLAVLKEHEGEIRRLAEERVSKARATLLEGVEALERSRAEWGQSRALTKWLDAVAAGGVPTASSRRGGGPDTMAPNLNPAGYLAQLPRPGRRNTGRQDDVFPFDEVVAALRELANPPAPPQKPEAQPLRRVA